MRIFFDSSAYAKRWVEESGSQEVEDLCVRASEVCLSIICVPEIVSALSRRVREKSLTRVEYTQSRTRLLEDANDAIIVSLTSTVVQTCITVLETASVRTLDAIHIASAIESRADLFVSSDHRQVAVAKSLGLETKQV